MLKRLSRLYLALLMVFSLVLQSMSSTEQVLAADLDLAPYVNPFIGTNPSAPDAGINNAAGDTFPGPVWPNGMVQFSPDTPNGNAGGYFYNQNTIKGFALTHFSGRGVNCWMDFPLMPTVGPLTSAGRKSSTFSHANESASAGYYSVKLDAYNIQSELTVTRRSGLARFTFPSSTAATVQLDTAGDASSSGGGSLTIAAPDTVTGSVSGSGCGGAGINYKLYFSAKFDRSFSSYGTWSGSTLNANGSTTGSGANLVFNTTANQVVQVKVGISFVSVANAQANLDAENPNWDFTAVKNGVVAAWNTRLNTIQVTGGTSDQKAVFYTALYHASIHPSTFSDTNGQYIGFDNIIHTTSGGRVQYHNFPAWDNYHSEMQLVALIAPNSTADMMQSLVNMAQQDQAARSNGGGLPRWQQGNDNSCGMEGDAQAEVIASAYAFGVTNFDTAGALAAMDRGASVSGVTSGGCTVREGVSDWVSKGYIPNYGSISLQYSNDDFTIAQFAKALGDTTKYNTYLSRAQNWKKLYNPAIGGFMNPVDANGNFLPNFSITCYNGGNSCQFNEGSSAQYTWMLPFNYRALFDKMGGNTTAVQRLDGHFFDSSGNPKLNQGPASTFAFMGNEPESVVPYAYAWAGAPYKTQDVVRRILLNLYSNSPGGMPGNDDAGAMSSWVVWAATGLRPAIPGVGGFVVGSPLFSSVTIRIAGGHTIQINAPAASDANKYIQSLNVNGATYNSPWLPWSLLSNGGTLDFALSSTANTSWGSNPADAPPSFDAPTSGPGVQLFFDDFNGGSTANWTPSGGTWAICQPSGLSKKYCKTDTGDGYSFAGQTSWTNYSVQGSVNLGDDTTGFLGILGRATDTNHWYQLSLRKDTGGVKKWMLLAKNGGASTTIASGDYNYLANTYYHLRLDMNGSTLTASISTNAGGTWTTLGSVSDTTLTSGKIGVKATNSTAMFDDLKVISD